ncbi:Por secretion system C-terminal sorting domain-containing protein [Halpernia humi]|uniref:Por secretion system C-terminal sorting domain-containing protein n=1 Tax=Halpernia humi TaxID=493375 RepID=A0A1H6A0A9_9FLAO|nr:T9SS type A sorting domain-containing protein [Halpernia humi]SEG41156.1 Por secretion system C-terminal sorting domain-containing protein [Halpernia humi]
MKTIYSLATVLFCSIAFAQTTITKSANDYLSGDTVNENNLTGTPDNSSTGSGVTFNNNSLTAGTAITGTVSTPSSAETTTYPGTTVKFSDGNGNDIFYKSSPTDLQITGATVGGAVLNFNTDNALFIKFPTAFSESYTDTASGTATYTGITVNFSGTITTTADASGTLLLDSKSFANIIRLKTEQNYILSLTGLGNIGTLTSTIYSYYDNSNRYPLFTTTTATGVIPLAAINQTSNLAVAQSTVFLGTRNDALKKKIQVYPNPVQNQLFFGGDLAGYTQVKIFNMEGRLVKSQNIEAEKINISALPAGNYILQLSGKDKKAQSINIIKK